MPLHFKHDILHKNHLKYIHPQISASHWRFDDSFLDDENQIFVSLSEYAVRNTLNIDEII